MPQGGGLTISAHRQNGIALAEVQEQGKGIPKELHDKVFELYFTTRKEGSGIGLAQTYQILQWHYGTVDFESAETTGTVFRFQIPIAASAAQAHSEYADDAATSQRGD
jgi:signal transduction histidine kinase